MYVLPLRQNFLGIQNRPPSKFGAVLVQEYKKRGITQYSLAKKMERSTRYLNNLEHDRNEPRLTTILLLADAIDMELGEFRLIEPGGL